MIDREELLELCRTEAPEPDDEPEEEPPSFAFPYPPITSTIGYPTYTTLYTPYIPTTPEPPIDLNGMVLHCAHCNNPLTMNPTSTDNGYWCDNCNCAPSLQDTYLARPKPFKAFKNGYPL